MNELTDIYNRLWDDAIPTFKAGQCQLDSLIQSPNDQRRGITLLVRLSDPLRHEIQRFLQQANRIEPDQYNYPSGDFHLTILSIITCVEGFLLSEIKSEDYIRLVRECCSKFQPFKIAFQGLTASASCVMVQGFPCDDQLDRLREALRARFKSSPLLHSIDARYLIKTAHSTVIRFQKPMNNPASFLELLDKYRDHQFGIQEIGELELVFNDWYQKKANTQLLKRFDLTRKGSRDSCPC